MPLHSMTTTQTKRKMKVGIVGAGAAGLCAAYTLQKDLKGLEDDDNNIADSVKIQILEASERMGGRLRKLEGFVDYPIDIGGEWIHGNPKKLFTKIIDDPKVQINNIETVRYNVNPCYSWEEGKFYKYKENWKQDHFMINYTWAQFVEEYFGKHVESLIEYNTPIECIDYTNKDRIVLRSCHGNTYEADYVILTASVTVLKRGDITFVPALPSRTAKALSRMKMHPGFKILFEFSEQFYHDGFSLEADDKVDGQRVNGENGERFFYNESWEKRSNRHVLSVFNYGLTMKQFKGMTDDEMVQKILQELDEMYDGKASATYIQHFVQNWTTEPYIGGLYSEWQSGTIKPMLEPVDDRIFFAGEAFPPDGENNGYAHGAAISGQYQSRRILSRIQKETQKRAGSS